MSAIDNISLYKSGHGALTMTAGADNLYFKMPAHEYGCGLLAVNSGSSAATITVKAGDSVNALDDLTVSVPAGAYYIISLKDSGRYKILTGENAGCVQVNAASGLKVALFEL